MAKKYHTHTAKKTNRILSPFWLPYSHAQIGVQRFGERGLAKRTPTTERIGLILTREMFAGIVCDQSNGRWGHPLAQMTHYQIAHVAELADALDSGSSE